MTREYRPEDGDVMTPKFTVHQFMRADIDKKGHGTDDSDVDVVDTTDSCTLFTSPKCSLLTSASEWLEGSLFPLI